MAAAAIKVVYNEEVEASADGHPIDNNTSDLIEEKSSFVSDELTERDRKYDYKSAANRTPHPHISLANMADPTQSQGSCNADDKNVQTHHQHQPQ